MAKGVGVDVGEYEIKAVELDGSYKKPRLTKFRLERVLRAGDGKIEKERKETYKEERDVKEKAPARDPHAQKAKAMLEAIGAGSFAKENMSAGVQIRDGVLRTIDVPFKGQDQIRKVIKFEVEGSIHSHQVDDMVVDFLPLEETADGTRVLVVAIPKVPLLSFVQTLEKGGLEPEVLDLDAMALYRVAEWCGVFSGAGAPKVKSKPTDLPAVAKPLDLLVDVGAHTTRVLVTSGGKFVDLRALRTGVDAIAEAVAVQADVPVSAARQAVEQGLRSGDDYVFVLEPDAAAPAEPAPAAAPAAGEGEAAATTAVVKAPASVPYATILRARDAFLDRLRKELIRFVAGSRGQGEIGTLYVTGGGSMLPGVTAVFEEVFGIASKPLDVLANVSHSLSPEEVQHLNPKLAVAIGLALRWLGGPTGFNFRQEELAFTRGFDRIKFPLAIAAMVAAFLLLVYGIKLYKELNLLEREYGMAFVPKTEVKTGGRTGATQQTRTAFTGYVGWLVGPGRWFSDPQRYPDKDYPALLNALAGMDPFNRLSFLKLRLRDRFEDLQKKAGLYSSLRLESGYGVIVRAIEILHSVAPGLGRFMVADVDLNLPAQPTGRYLSFTLVLRSSSGANFRERFDMLERAFRDDIAKNPESPFTQILKGAGEKTFKGGGEDEGAYYELKLELKPKIDVFHASKKKT